MKSWRNALIAVTALLSAYAIYVTVQLGPLRQAQRKLFEFCHRTAWAIRNDQKDLESGDLERQNQAIRRFTRSGTYHDIASIETCLDDVPPHDPDCFWGGDVGCRAALARAIADAIEKRY